MLEAKSGSNGSTVAEKPGKALFTAASSPSASRAERWLREQLKRARREGVFTITAELTPELAELLLSVNPNNRNLSQLKIAEYSREIRAGNWQHNGETIIVAGTGELNDGQHRCEAVIETGRPIITEMTFGVSRDSRDTLDVGLKRSVGQHLAMVGHRDVNVLGHAIRLIIGYDRYGVIAQQSSDLRPTTTEVLSWAEKNDIRDHISWGHAIGKPFGISSGLMAAISYALHKVDASAAETFLSRLQDGYDLPKGSPILTLRNLMMNRKGGKARYLGKDTAALFIKAWNRWRTGESRGPLQWRSTGQFAEKFPKPE